MVEFQGPREEREFNADLHPDTRAVVLELGRFCVLRGLRPPLLTVVGRTDQEQEDLYWRDEQEKARRNGVNIPEEQARRLARAKPSWHKRLTSVDLRTIGPNPADPHWTPSEMERVVKRLEELLGVPRDTTAAKKLRWEFLVFPHGTGPHIHFARRDFAWRPPRSTTT